MAVSQAEQATKQRLLVHLNRVQNYTGTVQRCRRLVDGDVSHFRLHGGYPVDHQSENAFLY